LCEWINRLLNFRQLVTAAAHLDALENHSLFILREANHAFRNMAMPWSMGKDSNVLLWLSRKAFFGTVAYPLLHIDTTYEAPEDPEIIVRTDKQTAVECVQEILAELLPRLRLSDQ
jgi:sulfate adenylyltransferase subunit 2